MITEADAVVRDRYDGLVEVLYDRAYRLLLIQLLADNLHCFELEINNDVVDEEECGETSHDDQHRVR